MRLLVNSVKKIIKHNVNTNYYYNWHNLKPPWNILFFGNDNFSLASLQILHQERDNNRNLIDSLEVVTTQSNNPVRQYAVKNHLNIHKWPLEDFSKPFHIGLVVSFGHLIPEDVINAFPMGMLNVHASLLPRWRGAAPIIYTLAHGDEATGVTIMRIRPKKFDIGEILIQESISIDSKMKMPELYDKLAHLGACSLVQAVRQLPTILDSAIPQDSNNVSYAPKVSHSMANVDFSKHSARYIYNLSRALSGLYSLSTSWHGSAVKLHEVVSYKCEKVDEACGFVMYDKVNKLIRIYCTDGYVEVKQIGISKKKKMSANEFYNGYISKQSIPDRVFK